jgi:thioredoxin-related protein
MKSALAILMLVFGSIFSQAQQTETGYPDKIPTFQFVKIKGDGVYKNTDIKKNKKTLIGFVSPDCIHCVLSLKHLSNNIDYLKDVNVIFVTEFDKETFINKFDSEAANLNNLKSLEILQDTEYEFGPLFHPLSLPTFYLYDKKGNLETVKRGSIEINEIFKHLNKIEK